MDLLMTLANVVVVAIATFLLMRFILLPHLACFVIGVPGGLAVFWGLLFGLLRVGSPRR